MSGLCGEMSSKSSPSALTVSSAKSLCDTGLGMGRPIFGGCVVANVFDEERRDGSESVERKAGAGPKDVIEAGDDTIAGEPDEAGPLDGISGSSDDGERFNPSVLATARENDLVRGRAGGAGGGVLIPEEDREGEPLAVDSDGEVTLRIGRYFVSLGGMTVSGEFWNGRSVGRPFATPMPRESFRREIWGDGRCERGCEIPLGVVLPPVEIVISDALLVGPRGGSATSDTGLDAAIIAGRGDADDGKKPGDGLCIVGSSGGPTGVAGCGGVPGPLRRNEIGTGPVAPRRSASILPTRVIPPARLPSGAVWATSTAWRVAATL